MAHGGKRGKKCILCCVVQMKKRNSRKLQLEFKKKVEKSLGDRIHENSLYYSLHFYVCLKFSKRESLKCKLKRQEFNFPAVI